MDGLKDQTAVIGLHNQLRTAKSVLGDDAHKTYRQIDDFGPTLARVELEGRA